MKNFLAYLSFVLIFASSSFAQNKETQDVYRNNLVIIFDASGSMDDNFGAGRNSSKKIDAAKDALNKVLQKVDESTNIGLFVFGDVRNNNPYPLGPKNSARLSQVISIIKAGGGTPLGEYMKKGADQLLDQREKQFGYGSYRMLVVTDGDATDMEYMNKVASEMRKRSIILDVIGVGMKGTHSLASFCSHPYRPANDKEALNKAISEAVAETNANSNGSDNDFLVIKDITPEQSKGIISAFSNAENQPIFEQSKTATLQSTASPSATATGKPIPAIAFVIAGAVLVIIFVFIGIIVNS